MPDLAQAVVSNTTPPDCPHGCNGKSGRIDESIGRRVARLSNLNVTGSIGVLVKAKSLGYGVSIPEALERMRERGVWLSQDVIRFALAQE